MGVNFVVQCKAAAAAAAAAGLIMRSGSHQRFNLSFNVFFCMSVSVRDSASLYLSLSLYFLFGIIHSFFPIYHLLVIRCKSRKIVVISFQFFFTKCML